MKRFVIAIIALLLLVGCKSKVMKELDRIEEEIATASTLDELTELSKEATSLMSFPTGELKYPDEGKELKRYGEIVELIQVRGNPFRKELRREKAENLQKSMREGGWNDATVTLLGDDEDILVISDPTIDEQYGRNTISWWDNVGSVFPYDRSIGLKKIIFRNDYGPVYTWEL
ncbi:hypothetical protein CEE36_08735 [candidate division TA06 bacterium B3_TA06]|uniref:Lipoprotein n=1 Tax=candidate division TA06 bacterium B3_TA06 TaxID=2012487 RepID=A0A532V1E8_UNCT6|nr:MAG: hypothetical protein CEE36_08735 [candidate division TA06 bacterium B3_TA06]